MIGRSSMTSGCSRSVAAAWLGLGLLLAACVFSGTAGAVERSARGDLKRVLILHSFGREFRPWSEYARSIKAGLEQQSPWPMHAGAELAIERRRLVGHRAGTHQRTQKSLEALE